VSSRDSRSYNMCVTHTHEPSRIVGTHQRWISGTTCGGMPNIYSRVDWPLNCLLRV